MTEKASHSLPEIRKTVVLNAPIEKVWKAVSTSEGIKKWFMPNNFEPVVGHEFTLQAGPYGDSPCKVTKLDPPYALAFNWDKDWEIRFELMELEDGRTEFTLIHAGWDANETTRFGQPHTVVRDIMAQGWEKISQSLPASIDA